MRRFLRSKEAIAVTEYGLLGGPSPAPLLGVVAIFRSSITSWFAARTSTIATV